jgi:hypothetical protein
MAIEKREMNGNWDLDPIREGFIYVILLQQNHLICRKNTQSLEFQINLLK